MDGIVQLVISFFDPRVDGVSVKGFSNSLGRIPLRRECMVLRNWLAFVASSWS